MRNKKTKLLISVVFIFALTMPMIVSLKGERKDVSVSEKRTLTTWLMWQSAPSAKAYFSNISDYVNDHFGFREQLITANTKLNISLKQSPVKKVLIGKDDWLFYRTFNPLLMLSLDLKKTQNNIDRRARHVSYRAKKMNEQSIAYLYTIAPNKMAVYQEQLPAIYSVADLNSDQQRLIDKLTPTVPPYFYDLKAHLIEQKANHSGQHLYFKNDTHWNQLGAHVAAQGLMAKINSVYPNVKLTPPSHTFTSSQVVGGDLAKFIGLNDERQNLEPITKIDACVRSNTTLFMPNIVKITCSKNDTKILLIGDSFRDDLYPYFAESVGTLYLARQGIQHETLDEFLSKVTPDLIIEEIVQRNLSKTF